MRPAAVEDMTYVCYRWSGIGVCGPRVGLISGHDTAGPVFSVAGSDSASSGMLHVMFAVSCLLLVNSGHLSHS